MTITTRCSFRLADTMDEWRCFLDGHACAPYPRTMRAPALCPRFTPSPAPCPLCLAAPAHGPAAKHLLLMDDSGATDAPGIPPVRSYACPACGYQASSARYALDMLATLREETTPPCRATPPPQETP